MMKLKLATSLQRVLDGEQFAERVVGERRHAPRCRPAIRRRRGGGQQVAVAVVRVRGDEAHGTLCGQYFAKTVIGVSPRQGVAIYDVGPREDVAYPIVSVLGDVSVGVSAGDAISAGILGERTSIPREAGVACGARCGGNKLGEPIVVVIEGRRVSHRVGQRGGARRRVGDRYRIHTIGALGSEAAPRGIVSVRFD